MNKERGLLHLLLLLPLVWSYHSPLAENSNSHCWPLNATVYDDNVINCGGLNVVWLQQPPSQVHQYDTINVSVNITAAPSYFTADRFSGVSSSDLKQFCTSECEPDCSLVGSTNCCVWHANVHVCYNALEIQACGFNLPCVPWIKSSSITEMEPQCGPLGTYTQQIMLTMLGSNTITYHLMVGEIQTAIGTEVIVEPYDGCGDGVCETSIESCTSCPEGMVDCVWCEIDCCPESNNTTNNAKTTFTFIFVTPTTVVVVIVLIVVVVKYQQKIKKLRDRSWIIIYSDIHTDKKRRRPSSFSGAMYSTTSSRSAKIMASDQDITENQLFIETGTYKERIVAIKRIGGEDLEVDVATYKSVQKEVMQVRALDHPNLCKFIGVTLDDVPPNVAIITEYCPKGSLNDVLQNEHIPLNWDFRLTFAKDIARGMAFLHSHSHSHGSLTSSNCVIDDRWVTKVTDYGIPHLRQLDKETFKEKEERRKASAQRVYLAPEVRDLPSSESTPPPADVYSYGIILLEIASRTDPFSDELEVDDNWKPIIDHTLLSDSGCPFPQDYIELIENCLTSNPSVRFTFDKVKKALHSLTRYSRGAVDNMMIMMEKYSKHLEQLVEERTQELMAEKERTTSLLYRMIPPAVAEELKQGRTVPATSFSCVTVFFSDIVGFTSLASSSTPMQIVDLLNRLYSIFDEILDQFDVYKVETIGDAYMVVSGVPRVNGDAHAGEIAKMALCLMEECTTFVIPHYPDKKLEIRAGIHSGSVCAGVVGKKMPRYCLFGDTVNTASRMESSSIAMHIQCSNATYQLLCKLGGFELESRGIIEVKGKGEMSTWWLKSYKRSEITPSPSPVRLLLPQIPAELIMQASERSTVGLPLSLEELRRLSVPSSSRSSSTAEVIPMVTFSQRNINSSQKLRFSFEEQTNSQSHVRSNKAVLSPILKKLAAGDSMQLGVLSDDDDDVFNIHNRPATNRTSISLRNMIPTTVASENSTEMLQLSSDELNDHSSMTGDCAVVTPSIPPRTSSGSLGPPCERNISSITDRQTAQSMTDVQFWPVVEESQYEGHNPALNGEYLTNSQSNDISGTNSMTRLDWTQHNLQSLQSSEIAFTVDVQDSLSGTALVEEV